MVSLKCKEIFCVVYSGALFISGLILIAFSVVLTYKVIYHFSFISAGVLGPLILLFILGVLHLFLTWLGVKGPPRENNVQILMFVGAAILLLLCEFTIGVWSLVLRDEQSIEAIELLTKSFNADEIKGGYNKKWSKLESQLKCCGLHGSSDFYPDCPTACLNHDVSNSTLQECFDVGCQKPLASYVKGILLQSTIIGFLSALYQVLGIFLFITYFRALRAERAERQARRSAIQRQMSQSQQGTNVPNSETPLVRPEIPSVPSSPPPPTSSPPPTTTT